jgi:ribosomal protein S18 acetylase RimI-like enzyme
MDNVELLKLKKSIDSFFEKLENPNSDMAWKVMENLKREEKEMMEAKEKAKKEGKNFDPWYKEYRDNQALERFKNVKWDDANQTTKTIKDGDKVIGVIQYDKDPYKGQASINELAVMPGSMGKGHGTNLLNQAIKDLKERGANKVNAHVTGDASSFYKKNGFKRVMGRIHSLELGKQDVKIDKSDLDFFNQQASLARRESFLELIKMGNSNIQKSYSEWVGKNEVNVFLKGYRELAMVGSGFPESQLDVLYSVADNVNDTLELKVKLDYSDRLAKVISIDSVAHALHQDKFSDGTSRYQILDELAGISKSRGEENRIDRLLVLDGKDPNSLNQSIAIIQKGVESSQSFWNLMVKAIKSGTKILSDDEVVVLREWVYSRI